MTRGVPGVTADNPRKDPHPGGAPVPGVRDDGFHPATPDGEARLKTKPRVVEPHSEVTAPFTQRPGAIIVNGVGLGARFHGTGRHATSLPWPGLLPQGARPL
ncbi:hypothetical protein StoSoilB22_05810 [Arthrobacter sp. StoSoilB22]|nr:hypothetical protein StoSoilB22_05810 [Arthrobacter sp. StoSoilB22]